MTTEVLLKKQTICQAKFTLIMWVLIIGFSHGKQIEFQPNTFMNCCYMDVCALDETRHHCPQNNTNTHSPPRHCSSSERIQSLGQRNSNSRCWTVNCNTERSWLRPGFHLTDQSSHIWRRQCCVAVRAQNKSQYLNQARFTGRSPGCIAQCLENGMGIFCLK